MADFVTLHAGQALEAQFQNGFGLDLAEAELAHQAYFGDIRGCRSPNQRNDFVQMVQGNQITFQDMGLALGFGQVVTGPSKNDFVTVIHKMPNQIQEIQRLRTSVDQCDVVD